MSHSLRKGTPRRSQVDAAEVDVLAWPLPHCPSTFTVYDKYARIERTLRLADKEWTVPVQGQRAIFRFDDGEIGLLQRKLVVLTHATSSPSSVVKFTRTLLAQWATYVELLMGGPTQVRDLWLTKVRQLDTATAGKTLLKLACACEFGAWTLNHLDMVHSLDTHAKKVMLSQHGKLKRREKVLPASTQAKVVRLLDETAVVADSLTEEQAEGLAALALVFQFGMRPVQLLSLGLEHVPEPILDASNDPVLVVSFHWAKQSSDRPLELNRQVRSEWVPLVNHLRCDASRSGRDRLFSCSTGQALWKKVRQVCGAHDLQIDFTAYSLRHTSIQNLADAGHERRSIQEFAGHRSMGATTTYLRATHEQVQLVNRALGVSKLYDNLVTLSKDAFITVATLLEADQEMQVGGIVGNRLVAGIGLCSTGQSACRVNPVTSCYGCRKFMPVAQQEPHLEAIAGMREQVSAYLSFSSPNTSPALSQLCTALSGAQQALEIASRIQGRPDD